MTYQVYIDTSDLEKVIGGYISRQRNYPMGYLALAMQAEVEGVIKSEGKKGTQGRWQPMSPATVARRRRGGGRGRPRLLQDTGVLANGQTAHGQDWAEVWSPAKYAVFHMRGTIYMPRRDPFAIKWDKILQAASEDLSEEIT